MSQQSIAAPATPKPMPKIKVAASYVRLAATCMAQIDIRYYLCGVRIEPRPEGGAFIVATNGHMMIAIIDKDGECSEPTIIRPNKATLAACPKARPFDRGMEELRTIEVEGETALGVTNNIGRLAHIQAFETIVEGKFPDWRKVLPDWSALEQGSPCEIEPHYRNAPMAAINAGKFFGVNNYHDKAKSMLVQRIANMDNVVHLVMARRMTDDPSKWRDLWAQVGGQEGGAA